MKEEDRRVIYTCANGDSYQVVEDGDGNKEVYMHPMTGCDNIPIEDLPNCADNANSWADELEEWLEDGNDRDDFVGFIECPFDTVEEARREADNFEEIYEHFRGGE